MKSEIPIIIFGYSFPHKKTCDFLTLMVKMGFENLHVIGAPKILLKSNQENTINDANLSKYDVKKNCSLLNISFTQCKHDNVKEINEIKKSIGAEIAIISGARILNAKVIELFPKGVVNFHPGKIPETSGLDSFYFTIKNLIPMGVTAHLIDYRVDAGKFIFFETLRISKGDSFSSVKESLYATQLTALKIYLKNFIDKDNEYIEIDRPKKNNPMNNTEKEYLETRFNKWKKVIIQHQEVIENQFFNYCISGSLNNVIASVKKCRYLVDIKNSDGYSGIMLASKKNHQHVVSFLREMKIN